MKKVIIMFVIAVLALAGCSDDSASSNITGNTGESKTEVSAHNHDHADEITKGNLVKEGDVYKITEENYIKGVNEVYGFYEDYLGERIEFEGEYMAEMFEGEMYYQVYRTLTVHNHEGDNHMRDTLKRVGFRISYDGDKPSDKSFVRVVGYLDTYEYQGQEYLILDADVLEVCDNPGIVELEQ